ncbi:MAG: hypothetical protein MI922_22485 [Bacteroidales bacterium]|nr:hypothetical protein [Bacteroidales bacterium]
MKKRIKQGARLLTLIILTTSCYEIPKEIESSITYTPGFAIPIGKVDIETKEFVDQLIPGNPVIDTVAIPDSLYNIIYDNKYYKNPVTLDTVLAFDFSMSDLNQNTEYIKEVVFNINITNGLPFNIKLAPSFSIPPDIASASNDHIFILDAQTISIDAAKTNDLGQVTDYSLILDQKGTFDEDRLKSIENTTQIVIPVQINTTLQDIESVFLDDDYYFSVQVGVKFKVYKEIELQQEIE